MIQTEFYVNGNLIELADDSLVAMSYNVNDIAEIKDRNADFSNIFKAPRSAKNDIALQYCSEISSPSNIPYRYGDARIVQGGVTILPIAIAEIRGFDDNFYQIKVLAGNATFFKSLGTRKISEVNLSAYDHSFDFSTVISSFGNIYTDGYKYPLINYGRITQTRTVRTDFLRPAFFGKQLITELFAGSGYTPAGDFLSSYELERLLIPFTNDKLLAPTSSGTDFTWLSPISGTAAFNLFFITHTLFNQNIGTARSIFQTPYNGNYKFRFSAHYENLTGAVPVLKIYYRLAGVDTVLDLIPFAQDQFLNGITTGVFTFEKEYHLPNLAQLSIDITCANTNFEIFGYPGGASPVDPDSFFECYDATDLESSYNHDVSCQLNLPNITQTDFLKSIAQMFGIVYTTDSLNKIVYFHQFKKLYQNKPFARDWTSKVEVRSANLEYKIGSYAQNNFLRWKEDSNDLEIVKKSADSFIPIDDLTLPESKDLVVLPFAATFEGYYVDNVKIPVIRKQKAPTVPDDTTFQISSEPRLLYDYTVNTNNVPGTVFTFTDTVATHVNSAFDPVPFCYFQFPEPFLAVGVTAGVTMIHILNFKDLIVDNYLELSLMLAQARLLKIDANINPTDIEILDHFFPIYLKQFAAYFYLNKIDRYVNDGRLTNIQLIRM